MQTNERIESAQDSYTMEINMAEPVPDCPHVNSEVIGGGQCEGQPVEVHRCTACHYSWEVAAPEVPNLTGETL